MDRALRRHLTEKKKKKEHPASHCGNAGCFICHPEKVLGIPDRQTMRQVSKEKTDGIQVESGEIKASD